MAETSVTTFVRRIGHALSVRMTSLRTCTTGKSKSAALASAGHTGVWASNCWPTAVRAAARDDAGMLSAVSVLVPSAILGRHLGDGRR
jgi:hypothetical protein